MASHSSQAVSMSSSDVTRAVFKLASPYLPCIHAAKELNPIFISQMQPETHHRGKQTVVRVDAAPTRIREALLTTIEDGEGSQALLLLYNQPSETAVPGEQILRRDSFYLIKEPFITVASNGDWSLQVDHPGDILLLSQDHDLLPVKWRKRECDIGRSGDLRQKGNDAVGKKRWAEAEDLQGFPHTYTTAIRTAETAEEVQLAYLNRSLANLRLGRPATALADALKSYGEDSSARTQKGLFREASALYHLAKYDQCLERLQTLVASYPDKAPAVSMIARVLSRLGEQKSGQYDFRSMYQQAQATPPLIDCATYSMPLEIRDSPGKGRGVFTTRKVLAGDLLVCEKAFGYACCGEDHPMTLNHILEILRAQIVQKLFHNIEDARSFLDLYHGDYDAIPVSEVDGHPVIDTVLVEKVIQFTASESVRSCLSVYRNGLRHGHKNQDDHYNSAGIWYLSSHMNHSCIGNASRSSIGDMQIVRASRDIEEGSELFVSYQDPHEFESYDEAQKRLVTWGFTCECALCLDRKVTSKETMVQRSLLVQDFKQLMDGQVQAADIPNAQDTLEKLGQTYSAAAKSPGAVRLELSDTYFRLVPDLIPMNRPVDVIEMTLRGLEALGFIISACPPRGDSKTSKPELLIRRWGMMKPFSICAFLVLHQEYKRIAPQLSPVARMYMEVAYSMVMGEKETILETYPKIA